ncbi:MAG: DHA2 family efflux MFS transporter permease subunit [Acidobacteriota bacterium]
MNAANGCRKWFVAITTLLGTFMEVLDTSVANVALPHIQGTYAAGVDEITWVLTSYLVANAVILPLSGYLGAAFSRKRVYMACLALFTASSFLAGAAPSLGFLILMRVLQGLSGGAMVPMSQAILLETFPREEHGKAMAVFGIGVVLAPVLGPLVGGWITDNWTWPWIFYINIPVGLLALVLAFLFVEDPAYLERPAGRTDFSSLLFVAVGLGSLEIFLNRGERNDWFESPFIQAAAAAAALFLALFVWRSLTAENPLVDLRVLKDRSFASGAALMFLAGFGMYGAFVLLPLFVQNLLGYTPTWAGLILSPGGAATMASMALAARLVGRVDTRLLVAAGFSCMAYSCWLLAGSTLEAGVPHFTEAWIYHGLGLGFFFVPIGVTAVRNIPPEKMGAATGLFNLMRNEGGSVGIAVSTTLLAQRGQFHHHVLAQHVAPTSPLVQEGMQATGGLLASSSGLPPASLPDLAAGLLSAGVQRQAHALSFLDVFAFLGAAFVLGLFLVPLLGSDRSQGGDTPSGRSPGLH